MYALQSATAAAAAAAAALYVALLLLLQQQLLLLHAVVRHRVPDGRMWWCWLIESDPSVFFLFI